jgi:hypothetical protein
MELNGINSYEEGDLLISYPTPEFLWTTLISRRGRVRFLFLIVSLLNHDGRRKEKEAIFVIR